ncbi:MAG: histidinol dehydrogenase [Candidatus Azotimanducaceae bacterium]|jgi:histidinol dehydrogenase
MSMSKNIAVRRLSSASASFSEEFQALLSVREDSHDSVLEDVVGILQDVKVHGDEALIRLTRKFDNLDVSQFSELEISQQQMAEAVERIDPIVLEALQQSIKRVRDYHQKQKEAYGNQVDWSYEDPLGNQLGQLVRGMERVGIYAPGGKAAYPSSVIMTAIPARVAEVGEIILTVPTPRGEVNEALMATAHLCGVDRLFTIGGAQAIGALAYGTETVPRVDKIVGPGNIYVATAKSVVFGKVGIDMIAGPSEIAIVADNSVDPEWLMMDMFAQAEHDELAQSVLISTDSALLDEVARLISARVAGMQRSSIIEKAIVDRGALILVRSNDEALELVNQMAPEHLEICLDDSEEFLAGVRNAGAVFVGKHTAEVVGDYTAGPSHVLPTSGTARFASPLGVYDFQVRSSLIRCSRQGAIQLNRAASIIARTEGLEAHALSAELRVLG